MASQTKPIDVEIGTGLASGIQFISQHPVEDENQPFSIDLPGTIYRCGEAIVQTILPRARIVVPHASPVRAARISAAVTDSVTLRRANGDVQAQIDNQTPLRLALRFTAARSMGEVLDAAAIARGDDSSGGCCCGRGEATLPGAVAIGLAANVDGDLKWSEPIGATIYAFSDGALELGGSDKAHCIAVRDNCTEDWITTKAGERTICKGFQCTFPEECRCGDNKFGNPLVNCPGWVRCNCNV